MTNEIILIISLIVLFGSVLLSYRLFGKAGLYGMTVFATITANIEVILLIDAFGAEMTLGNILFAMTFLITDILSENEGKRAANLSVAIGIATCILFIFVSQSWMLYVPSANDWAQPAFRTIFTNTPRMMLASVLVYAIAQVFDVWLYHAWWKLTTRKSGDSHKYLWLRNNGSTMVSQLLNTVLFTVFAFWGIYDMPTMISIILSSYIIFIVTSLADTPILYWARRMKEQGKVGLRCLEETEA